MAPFMAALRLDKQIEVAPEQRNRPFTGQLGLATRPLDTPATHRERQVERSTDFVGTIKSDALLTLPCAKSVCSPHEDSQSMHR
jgi:hypothetical protein